MTGTDLVRSEWDCTTQGPALATRLRGGKAECACLAPISAVSLPAAPDGGSLRGRAKSRRLLFVTDVPSAAVLDGQNSLLQTDCAAWQRSRAVPVRSTLSCGTSEPLWSQLMVRLAPREANHLSLS